MGSIPTPAIMKIAILGFGREGRAVLKFLKKNKIDKEIWILDEDLKIKAPAGVNVCFGKNYLKNLNNFDIIFRSPGVPYNLPEIQKAVKKGVRFSSATKLFFEKAQGKVIGITGTKGKGTTATLIYKILKAAKRDAYLVGNIGKPCLAILPRLNKNSIVVFELSSFQLQDLDSPPHQFQPRTLGFQEGKAKPLRSLSIENQEHRWDRSGGKSPNISVILDIFPDHLDIHKNLKEYLKAKTNIVRYQRSKDKIFYFADNFYSQKIAAKSKAKKIPIFVSNATTKAIASGITPTNLKIKGHHNFKNALMAAAVTERLGVKPSIIKKTILNFCGLEDRLEFVDKINGVSIYNDSASTNPESAAAAVQSFIEPQILIAGGKDKNLDFKSLARALKNSSVKKVFLFGENKNKIKAKINKIVLVKTCPDLKTSLEKALKIAYNGDVIVFSPASASFDMFRDYKDRGKIFKKLVKKILLVPHKTDR